MTYTITKIRSCSRYFGAADSGHSKPTRHPGCGLGQTVWSHDEGLQSSRQTQCRTVPRRLCVSTDCYGGDTVEIANCDLKFTNYRNDKDYPELVTICDRFPKAPRSSVSPLGVHRARRCDGRQHSPQRASGSHECLCGTNVCASA